MIVHLDFAPQLMDHFGCQSANRTSLNRMTMSFDGDLRDNRSESTIFIANGFCRVRLVPRRGSIALGGDTRAYSAAFLPVEDDSRTIHL